MSDQDTLKLARRRKNAIETNLGPVLTAVRIATTPCRKAGGLLVTGGGDCFPAVSAVKQSLGGGAEGPLSPIFLQELAMRNNFLGA